MVKSDEFENSSPLYIFPLNPDYVAARSLRSLRSNKQHIHHKAENIIKGTTTAPWGNGQSESKALSF